MRFSCFGGWCRVLVIQNTQVASGCNGYLWALVGEREIAMIFDPLFA